MSFAVSANAVYRPTFLQHAVVIGLIWGFWQNNAVGDDIVIPAAVPAAFFMPLINEGDISEFGIGAVNDDFICGFSHALAPKKKTGSVYRITIAVGCATGLLHFIRGRVSNRSNLITKPQLR